MDLFIYGTTKIGEGFANVGGVVVGLICILRTDEGDYQS